MGVGMRDWSWESKWRMESRSGEIEGNQNKEKEVGTMFSIKNVSNYGYN